MHSSNLLHVKMMMVMMMTMACGVVVVVILMSPFGENFLPQDELGVIIL